MLQVTARKVGKGNTRAMTRHQNTSTRANVKGESNTKPTCRKKIPVAKPAGARSHGLRRDKFTYGNAQQRVANGKRTGMVNPMMQAESAFDALSARQISGQASKSQQFQSRLCMCIAAQSAVRKLKPQRQMEQCMCNTKRPAVPCATSSSKSQTAKG